MLLIIIAFALLYAFVMATLLHGDDADLGVQMEWGHVAFVLSAGDFGTGDDTRLTAASDAFDDAAALSTSLQSNERDAGGAHR